MSTKSARESYEAPSMMDIGAVGDLTSGPVAPWAESPSGQTQTHSDDAIPATEAE